MLVRKGLALIGLLLYGVYLHYILHDAAAMIRRAQLSGNVRGVLEATRLGAVAIVGLTVVYLITRLAIEIGSI